MSRKEYDPEANASAGQGSHIVFHPDQRVKFPPTGDSVTTFVIAPARPFEPIAGWDIPLSQQYVPYRKFDTIPPEGKPHKMSHWIRPYWLWSWVNGAVNIISPKTYLDEKTQGIQDPVKTLVDHIVSRGNLWHLLGLEPDGKRSQSKERNEELFESKILSRYAEKRFLVNACLVVNADRLEPCGLFSLMEGAVVNRASASPGENRSAWGLFDELARKSRNVSAEEILANPCRAYFWGDITDPQGAIPISLYKEKPPTGGAVKLWVSKPSEMTPRPISIEKLEARVDLCDDSQIFVDYSPRRVVEELIRQFGNTHADLLVGAFGGAFPIRHMIQEILSGGEVVEDFAAEEPEKDDIPMSYPVSSPTKTQAAQAARSYAPPPSVLENASKNFWMSVNGGPTTPATADQARIAASENLPGVVMLIPQDDATGGWRDATAFGFQVKQATPPPPPPPPASAPPAPPPPPASAPSASTSAPLPSSPPALIESPAPEAAVTGETGVTMEMLRAQLGASPEVPASLASKDAPPPPPPAK